MGQRERNRRRLRWAVAFATQDLANLRPGDRLNLHDDMWEFLGYAREGGSLPEESGFLMTPYPGGPTDTDHAALQAEARRFLEWVASPPDPDRSRNLPHAEITATWKVARNEDGAVGLMVVAPVRELFLTRLFSLLAQEGVGNLLLCPECKRVFWKVGRKKYCSRRCTNRAVFQAWSKDPKKRKARSRREVERQQTERARHETAMEQARQRATAKKGGHK